ncbi:MAG: DUF3021 domain-containing protein [Lachnospiraceae bacterium]|nr:DUF3021 domain-containing protein [Lachnospiraceae bacterium]
MDNNLKTGLTIKILIGCLVGGFICVMLYAFGAYDNIIMDKPAVIAQILGSMIFGAICMGTQIVYDIESWGIRKSTTIHYLICIIAFIFASSILKWFRADIMWMVLIIFTISYVFIWLIYSAIYKREVREMNNDLEKMLRKGQEGGRQ